MSDPNKKPKELPKHWIQRVSKSRNKPYYFNMKTRQSVWKLSDVFDTNLEGAKIVEPTKDKNNGQSSEKLKKSQSASKSKSL